VRFSRSVRFAKFAHLGGQRAVIGDAILAQEIFPAWAGMRVSESVTARSSFLRGRVVVGLLSPVRLRCADLGAIAAEVDREQPQLDRALRQCQPELQPTPRVRRRLRNLSETGYPVF
jgi:hypothetical protein